ncbi:hypothetical protein, partial [Escherichia coli]
TTGFMYSKKLRHLVNPVNPLDLRFCENAQEKQPIILKLNGNRHERRLISIRREPTVKLL